MTITHGAQHQIGTICLPCVGQPLLSVRGLQVVVPGPGGQPRTLLAGVNLQVHAGRPAALLGESGSGKTLTALALMGLAGPSARVQAHQATLGGHDLLAVPPARLRELLGQQIAMVFQHPRASLDPMRRIGDLVAAPFVRHRGASWRQAREMAVEWLFQVGIAEPSRLARRFAGQLSVLQAQQIKLAIATALRPALLVADEPTTGLDISERSRILGLLCRLCEEGRTTLLLLTKEPRIAAMATSDATVLLAGRTVERVSTARLLEAPYHPYTQHLMASLPVPGDCGERALQAAAGRVAPPAAGQGCAHAGQCGVRLLGGSASPCATQPPPWQPTAEGGGMACWRAVPQA